MNIDTKSCKLNTYLNGGANGWSMVFKNKSGNTINTKYFSTNKQLGNFLSKRLELRKNAPREALRMLAVRADSFVDQFKHFEERVGDTQEIYLDSIAPNTLLQRVNKGMGDRPRSYWQWGYKNKNDVFSAFGVYGNLENIMNSVIETTIRDSEKELDSIEELLVELDNAYAKAMDIGCSL